MAYLPTAYDDADTTAQMHADCAACAPQMNLVARATRPAPSIRFEDVPRDLPKPEITISEATARLAGALRLHLD